MDMLKDVEFTNDLEMEEKHKYYQTLEKITMKYSSLTKIPSWIFECSSLVKLYIINTLVTLLPDNLPPNLIYLDCSRNHLISLPDTLPQSLTKLHCYCNQLTSLPILPQNLIGLCCSHNYLTSLPDNLPQSLTELECYNNRLTSLPILPQNLTRLECSHNSLFSLPLSILRCHRMMYLCYYNNPIEYQSPQILRFINRIIGRLEGKTTVYSDSQSIHNSKIQESVYKSIMNITKKGSKEDRESFRIEEVLGDEILEESVKQALLEYIADKTEHSLLYITFEELFIDVWNRIKNHKDSIEIKKILNQEMSDALCKCFTGRLTRLVNCLNGYFDDVVIHISNADQIGNIILIAKEKLEGLGEYTVEKHKETVRKELKERDYEDETIEEWLAFIE